jgi:hypothetical protein
MKVYLAGVNRARTSITWGAALDGSRHENKNKNNALVASGRQDFGTTRIESMG